MFTLTFPEAVFIRANSLPAPSNAASSSKPVPKRTTDYLEPNTQWHKVGRNVCFFNSFAFWTISDAFATLSTHPQYDMHVAGVCLWKSLPNASFRYFLSLTDDVEILLEVKERDPAGVQTFPCQLQLQFLLQGWVRAHSIDPHHKTILQKSWSTGGNRLVLWHMCNVPFRVPPTMLGHKTPLI